MQGGKEGRRTLWLDKEGRGESPRVWTGKSTACLALGLEAAEALACLWKGNGASDSSGGSCSQIRTLLRSSHTPPHPLPLTTLCHVSNRHVLLGFSLPAFFFSFFSLQWLRLDRNAGMSPRPSKGPDPQPP